MRPNPAPLPLSSQKFPTHNLNYILAWLIPIGASIGGGIALLQKIPLANLYWPSLIFGVLLLLTAFGATTKSRLRNVASLLMVVSFTTALASFLSIQGLTLVGVELFLLVSILAISAGWIFQSRPSALLSVAASLLYLTSYFPELGLLTGISDEVSQLGAGIVPWLVLGQITLAQKVKSSTVLTLSIAAGYIWMTTLASGMPLAEMAGIGFVIAAAHYWFGKSRAEHHVFGGETHRICAWIIALGAALYVQSIWLNVAAIGQAKPYAPPSPIWWTILGVSVFTLFVVSLQRYKTSHISLFGIFVICAAVLIVPAATIKPEWVYSAFDAIPGLKAHPGLGFVLGATIIAAGFYWIVGGLKAGRPLDMSMGAIAIGIEALILFQPEKFNADLGVIFVVSLICALCIGGLVAGVSTDRSHTVDNYL